MSEKTSYQPGEFCWSELSTSDATAATRFYTSFLGWKANEIPMGPDQPPYVMLLAGDRDAAALYQSKDAHPHWNVYIAVANVDETAKKAKSLGAKILQEPFDVMDLGRMATIQDPQGAAFCVWQAAKSIGARVQNEHGAMCWNELYTNDIEGARKFYSDLFGWKLKVSPEYTEVHAGSAGVGGMMQIRPDMQGIPPNWMPYFMVDDCDAAVNTAKKGGGAAHHGPMDIEGIGRFAVMGDPQGAGFALITLKR
jgi:predicted enzyme related to lactoylglutathione lyase